MTPPTSSITRIHFLTQLLLPRALPSRSLRDRLLAGALAGVIGVAMAAPALAAEPAPAEAASAPSAQSTPGAPAARPAKANKHSAAKNSAMTKPEACQTAAITRQ